MCGRFAVTTDPALLAEKIRAIDEASGARALALNVAPNYNFAPNYNVAPTTAITTVVSRHAESDPDDEPTRRVRLMRWGLLPPWVKAGPDGAPETKGPLLINARAEKVASSPAFRGSAKSKRCLVPMDGWYEWRPNVDGDRKSPKTPYFMHRRDGETLFMAGLWSVWKPDKEADPLLSCTIITTDAVGELARIHDRMPLILDENDWDRWLDPDTAVDAELLARPPDVHDIDIREISTLVNSIRNNGPELLAPVAERAEQMKLL